MLALRAWGTAGVIPMDDKMRDARMLRILLRTILQDGDRIKLVGIGRRWAMPLPAPPGHRIPGLVVVLTGLRPAILDTKWTRAAELFLSD